MSDIGSPISESITFKNSQGLDARGTVLKISQNHIVFETYNPYSIVQLSEVLNEVRINRFNEIIYNGKAVVSNLINTGLLIVVSATLVDSFSEKSQTTKSIDVGDAANQFVFEWQQLNNKIPNLYQISIGKLRSFLFDANRWIEQLDIDSEDGNGTSYNNLVNKISESFLPSLGNLLINFESEASKIDTSTDKSVESICKKHAQKELHPLIMQSPFMYRCFSKPLGYAGDYEMVNMMLRDPYEGETPYAQLINLFFLKAGPAEAHRNRIDILYSKIKEVALKAKKAGHKAKIFNFACGPAIEIQKFIEGEEISENCEFTLLDFNKQTLQYTADKIDKSKQKSGNRKVDVNYINKSAHEVLKEAVNINQKELPQDNFDLVYCAGLFDYLSDKVCARLLQLFFWQLKPGGDLLATNVHTDHPVKALMEYLMEWYLVYRNEDEFLKLIDVKEKKIYADPTGYNIFLDVHKSI